MSADYDVSVARVRKSTLNIKKLSKLAIALGTALYPEDTRKGRPTSYGDCLRAGLGGATPCPYVSCVHHLALDVSLDTGSITTNFPDRDPDEIPATCDLAVAALGGLTLEEVGAVLNVTRERLRQIEMAGLAKLAAHLGASFDDLATEALSGARPGAVTAAPAPKSFVHHAAEETSTGQRYGRLVVRSFGWSGRYRSAACDCDCGEACVKRLSSLRSGHVKSCGCLGRSGAGL